MKKNLKSIVYSLEKYSTHPLAKCISKEWKIKNGLRWARIQEIKGIGIQATDKEGNEFIAGSYKIAAQFTKDDSHNIYLIKNNQLTGWIDITDEIRPEAKQVIDSLKAKNIKPFY